MLKSSCGSVVVHWFCVFCWLASHMKYVLQDCTSCGRRAGTRATRLPPWWTWWPAYSPLSRPGHVFTGRIRGGRGGRKWVYLLERPGVPTSKAIQMETHSVEESTSRCFQGRCTRSSPRSGRSGPGIAGVGRVGEEEDAMRTKGSSSPGISLIWHKRGRLCSMH